LADAVGLAFTVGVALAVGLAFGVGVALAVGLAFGVALAVGVGLAVGLTETDALADGLATGSLKVASAEISELCVFIFCFFEL
jgi:hypothetical protein